MLQKRVSVFLVVASTLLMSVPGFAWNEAGHKITAYIAWQRMTPEVRAKVFNTLLAAPEDAQLSTFYAPFGSRSEAARQREFFMIVATWADIIRDKNFPVRQKNYAHSDWHYSDTFWEYKDGKVNTLPPPDDGGKALEKLVGFDKVIRSKAPDTEKAIAIAWLVHVIGDIHQPLHTSARVTSGNKKGDQGGNLFFLTPKGTPRAQQQNLHWFWDSIISTDRPNTKDLCDADYLDPIAEAIMKQYPYDKLKGEIADGKFDVWKEESFKIASTEVFRGVSWFEMPSDKYKKKAVEIAERRLALAGYRMGDLFNSAFTGTAASTFVPQPRF